MFILSSSPKDQLHLRKRFRGSQGRGSNGTESMQDVSTVPKTPVMELEPEIVQGKEKAFRIFTEKANGLRWKDCACEPSYSS